MILPSVSPTCRRVGLHRKGQNPHGSCVPSRHDRGERTPIGRDHPGDEALTVTDTKRTSWADLKRTPRSKTAEAAYEGEAHIAAFRELVSRLRTEAGLTQAGLAERMGTTQSAIARMEGGSTRPALDTLEKLAAAVGADLVVGMGENLSENRSIAKLEHDGHAVVRRAC